MIRRLTIAFLLALGRGLMLMCLGLSYAAAYLGAAAEYLADNAPDEHSNTDLSSSS
jgi:hypothetical protein